jgi:hypothetical protein
VDWCVVQKEEVNAKYTLDEEPSIFIRDNPILSSERILHKDYYRKSSVGKQISGRDLKGPGAKTNWLAVNLQ